MVTIYLDQNAASYLARAESGSDWELIREKLTTAFLSNRIICPLPTETLVESAPCQTKLRIAIEELFQSVSNGERFRHMWELMVDETLRLARPSHVIHPFGMIGAGWGEREEAARIAKEAHSEGRDKMRQRAKAHQYSAGGAARSPEEIFRSGARGRCGMFFRDLGKFEADPATLASDYESGWLIKGLISHKLTLTEASKIKRGILFHKWERIPVNHFDLLLGSWWEHDLSRGKRYEPNDEIDRWRSTVALCYSDFYITDGYAADLCRRSRVADQTTAKVLSTRQTNEILQFLEECL